MADLPTKQDVIDTLNSFYGTTIYSDFSKVPLSETVLAILMHLLISSSSSEEGSVSVSNFPTTQPVSIQALPLPTGAATSAKQPSIGTAGNASPDVISIQGVNNGISLSVIPLRNATTTSVVFTAATTSSTFTIQNRLAMIICPAITGSPTLTLQVTLDGGTSWVNSSVILATEPVSKIIEADSLAKLSGAFGLSNAFRFSSTSAISATLQVRSIAQ